MTSKKHRSITFNVGQEDDQRLSELRSRLVATGVDVTESAVIRFAIREAAKAMKSNPLYGDV